MAHKFWVNWGALSLSRFLPAAASFLSLPILTHYLSPAEFGLAALALSFVNLANVVSDAGLGQSLIAADTDDAEVWSTVFWLVLMICGALGLVLVLVGWGAAVFYGEARLQPMVAALGLAPVLLGASSVPQYEMRKRGAYHYTATIQVIASVLGVAVVVGLAHLRAGAWAMVGQTLVMGAVQVIGSFAFSRFRPRLVFARNVVREHLGFGADTTAVSFIRILGQEMAPIAIARALGPASVGFLSMSLRIGNQPQTGLAGPLGEVLFTLMAQRKDEPRAPAQLFLTGLRILAAVIFIPMAMLAAAAGAVLGIILSDKWEGIAPVFALLLPGIALQTVMSLNGLVFMTMNQTGRRMRMTIEMTLLWLVVLFLSLPFGILAVAAARSLWFIAYSPRIVWHMKKIGAVGYADVWSAIARPLGVALSAALVHVTLARTLTLSGWTEIGLAACVTLAAYGAFARMNWRAVRADLAMLSAQRWRSA